MLRLLLFCISFWKGSALVTGCCASVPRNLSRALQIHMMPSNPFGEENTHEGDGEAPPILRILETCSHLSWNVDAIDVDDFTTRGSGHDSSPHPSPLHGILPQVNECYPWLSLETSNELSRVIVRNLPRSNNQFTLLASCCKVEVMRMECYSSASLRIMAILLSSGDDSFD